MRNKKKTRKKKKKNKQINKYINNKFNNSLFISQKKLNFIIIPISKSIKLKKKKQ